MHDTLSSPTSGVTGLEVAIIGMAGRFPGAHDVGAFWENLIQGKETIRPLTRDELMEQGVAPEAIDAPGFVAAGSPLDLADRFDAAFFGYSPREAEILDPQQRLFLECAWHALETAGYAPGTFQSAVGVYAAAGMNAYLFNLHSNAGIRSSVSPYELFIANDKDFLATRTAYKLDLRGPAMTVQTACSSSLVAVHLAVQSLVAGECDMAIAGGVALSRQRGYRAEEGSILSPDGHCRAFDAKAAGTVGGNGVGIVVLKRLEDALADGDTIDAVIKGSAVNNDGSLKASFTAPQVDSQTEVIAAALAAAGIGADSIGYVEAHGTGTALGDPIEIAALTKAFRRDTKRSGFCAIGSVKTNIGHLDTAAGIAGLIKSALMLRHRKMPPSLHFTTPNPKIDFASSPFAVNSELREWADTGAPRRAGVSSFGIGGTNAHVILEEAPPAERQASSSRSELLVVSARNEAALGQSMQALADHIDSTAPQTLADIAQTLREGRRPFAYRHAVLASTSADAARALRLPRKTTAAPVDAPPSPILLFPGQGSQYPGMAKSLYADLPAFRVLFDTCCDRLQSLLGQDIRALIFSGGEDIHETALAQPALFAVEYALGRLWLDMGLKPRALHGHSIGEYVAATLSGVFDLDTALGLIVGRGRLMSAAAPGAMMAVIHPDREIDSWITGDLALAARNAPGLSVVSGPTDAIAALRDKLKAEGVATRRLQTSHAFHSPMMAEAAVTFEALVSNATLSTPCLPMISNVTGTWLTDEQATDPAYWSRHLLGTVHFGQGTTTLLSLPNPLVIEAGPGQTLGLLSGQQFSPSTPILPGIVAGGDETAQFLGNIGRVWASGADLLWGSVFGRGRRVPLPVYPFERQRYWIDADSETTLVEPKHKAGISEKDMEGWFYRPSWRRAAPFADEALAGKRWLVFDDGALGSRFCAQIERAGGEAYRVLPGDGFGEPDFRCFSIATNAPADHRALLDALKQRGAQPDHVLFLWSLTTGDTSPQRILQNLIDALARAPSPVRLTVMTRGAADVTGVEHLDARQSVLNAMVQVAGQEYPWLGCRCVDLDPSDGMSGPALVERLRPELSASKNLASAWRGANRWVLDFAAQALPHSKTSKRFRRNGVFVVAGHLADGMGRVWVENLAKLADVRLALIEDISATPLAAHSGVETIVRRIDCSKAEEIDKVLGEIARDWGRIDGVFFSTPMSNHDAAAPLALMSEGHWTYNQSVRVAPLLALAEALSGHKPSFCCVQSSLSSVIGGIGLAAYAGTYGFIDSFVAGENRKGGTAWFSMNWDALNDEIGITQAGRHVATNDFALSPDEAWECTRRLIEGNLHGQTVVSRGDLAARRAEWLSSDPHTESDTAILTHGHARPDLATPYIAPRNEVERVVAGILQDLLGIDAIGVDDGFFELGGHSLLAIRAIARLREAFPVDVEMRELLFENPTAAGIAQAISTKLPDQSELDAMAALLSQIDELSDDDVNDQLPRASAK